MKVCGYCNNEYNDTEPKCPVCGSTLLKHNKHSDPAEAELKRIKDEIERKRKSRSLIIGIGAAVIILAIVIAIFSIVGYVTDPQRDIAKESKELFAQAEQQIDNKNYDAAIDTLDQINPEWDDYADVEALRVEAVRSQLTTKVAEYQAAGNYQGIITFIKENVADINSDPEIKAAYNSAVQQYVSAVLVEADEHLSTANYNSARTVLNTAVALVGEDVNITEKLAEIEHTEILANIQTYEESEDYISLVLYLEGIIYENDDYQSLYLQYCKVLEDKTLEKAQNLADERQYAEAIDVLENAQYVCYSEILFERIEEYEKCLPRALADCHVIDSENAEFGVTATDCFGTNYDNVITFDESYSGENGGFAVFNLDGNFASLSGCFVGTEDLYKDMEVTCKIYADGKLLYESSKLGRTSNPATINLDITGTKQLRIEYMWYSWWTYDPCCIFDLTVS